MVAVLITGFPAGMLACNCYVLAQRAGADAIVVDPGQRGADELREPGGAGRGGAARVEGLRGGGDHDAQDVGARRRTSTSAGDRAHSDDDERRLHPFRTSLQRLRASPTSWAASLSHVR